MRRKYLACLFVSSLAMMFVCGCKKQAPASAPAPATSDSAPAASDSAAPPASDSAPAPAQEADIPTKVCAQYLNIIANGKRLWAQQYQKGADDVPTMEDLAVFIRHTPKCPAGGTYTLGKVGEWPSCSIPGHQAEFLKSMQAGSTDAAR